MAQSGPAMPAISAPAGSVRTAQEPARRPPPTDKDQPPAKDRPLRDVPLTPIVVEEVGPVTPETGVGDVLLGAIGLVVVLILAALVLGAAGGALRVYILHRLGYGGPEVDEADHIRLAIGRDGEPPARD